MIPYILKNEFKTSRVEISQILVKKKIANDLNMGRNEKKEMKKMCANSNTSQGHYVLLVPFFNTSVYIFSLHFFFSGDLFMFYLSVIFIVLLLYLLTYILLCKETSSNC